MKFSKSNARMTAGALLIALLSTAAVSCSGSGDGSVVTEGADIGTTAPVTEVVTETPR